MHKLGCGCPKLLEQSHSAPATASGHSSKVAYVQYIAVVSTGDDQGMSELQEELFDSGRGITDYWDWP